MTSEGELPERCDVAVLGAGLAGLLAADRLADSGSVVLLAAESVSSASSCTPGIVACGTQDSPARLVHGLGEERASLYWQWSSGSVEALFQLAERLAVPWSRTGSWRLALEEQELAEWRSSLTLLDSWNAEADCRSASDHELSSLGEGFAGGVFVPRDGWIDIGALCAALAASLEGRVVRSTQSAQLSSQNHESGAKVLELSSGAQLHAEAVVIAAGWNTAAVDQALASMVFPVRLQALRTEPLAQGAVPVPVLARHRFESWLQEPTGEVVFSGCRWAEQPEMGAGITDASNLSEAVLEKQKQFIEAHLPSVRGAVIRECWSGIAAWSCDGLPLVGYLPGNPRVTVLAGWGGTGLSLVAAAVAAVADGLRGVPGNEAPGFLHPRRML